MDSDHDILVRLDQKMDSVMLWQQEHRDACHTVHADHEERLRGLERWKWKEAGVLSIVLLGFELFAERIRRFFGS